VLFIAYYDGISLELCIILYLQSLQSWSIYLNGSERSGDTEIVESP